jgi:hypothetical protein
LNVQETVAVRDEVFRGDFLWMRPWLLMMLELWCREVADKTPSELTHAHEMSQSARLGAG